MNNLVCRALFPLQTQLYLVTLVISFFHQLFGEADPLKKTPQQIEEALRRWRVIPDVIDAAPKKAVKVYYESEVFPDFGNKIHADDAEKEPYMIEWDSNEEKYYLLLMVDPDVPTQANPVHGQYEHFVVGNIQYGNMIRGTYLSDYVGPHLLPQTGYHRFVFLIYEQPEEMEFSEKRITWTKYGDIRRFNFSAKDYAAKYYLGQPCACNFFISEYEPSRKNATRTLTTKIWRYPYGG